jgi:hypothetical protein
VPEMVRPARSQVNAASTGRDTGGQILLDAVMFTSATRRRGLRISKHWATYGE